MGRLSKAKDLIEDADWLFANGGLPEQTATQLGMKLEALRAVYRRAERPFPFRWDSEAQGWVRR